MARASWRADPGPEAVAAIDHVVERADALQHELGERPCRDSSWRRETLVIPDLAADDHRPRES
jgi:hypothetical protein